ncbi:MAG: NAD-dependent DNA ligase LigA [Oscillospiraceae bacterium]|nr:NAD-dependent DNA ligase LigA [Oscillospiraceae bacterium]
MDDRQKIARLREEIEAHNHAYYVLDNPSIPDHEYDALMRRLRALEEAHPEEVPPDSPTVRVGGRAAFSPVRHAVPLESLNDVFTWEELTAFDARVRAALPGPPAYVLEPKVDGLSVALTYEDNRFASGATRGDGVTGEDVTHNLLTLQTLPKTLCGAPARVVVRGEVFMSKAVFRALNAEREARGEPLLANPRNAAAGSLRQLDPEIAARRRLDIVLFNIQDMSGPWPETHHETLTLMASWGLPVIPHTVFTALPPLLDAVAHLDKAREEHPFDLDGAVVKLDSLSGRQLLGSTARAPRWAAAYKYPPEQKETILTDITIQVGRTGVLTPRATLAPVRLAGTTVTNATLHNEDFIRDKDIRIGDTVLVQKAGEIIPEILSVTVSQRPADAVPYVFPDVCPACGAAVVREAEESAARCTGAECPAQRARRLAHFASRGAMDIEGLGPATVELLLARGLIETPADLFRLTPANLADLPGFAEKSAANLVAAIDASRRRSLERLLFALGIPQVGQKASAVLARHFGSLEAIRSAALEDLTALRDIGPATAESLRRYLDSPQGTHLTDALAAAGVRLTAAQPRASGDRFAGQTFVLTGTLQRHTRDQAAQRIAAEGGRVSASVSERTTYVLAGEKAGSKLAKAEALGIPILTEEAFEALFA